MRRLSIVALLVLVAGPARAAAADPEPPASDDPDGLVQWLEANVDARGWEIADVSQTDALYLRPAPAGRPPPLIVRTSARWESFARPTPEHPWRSALQGLEIDCRGRRFRELSWTAYAGSNLMGEVVVDDAAAEEAWHAAAPGSVMVSAVERSCPSSSPPAQGSAGDSAPSR